MSHDKPGWYLNIILIKIDKKLNILGFQDDKLIRISTDQNVKPKMFNNVVPYTYTIFFKIKLIGKMHLKNMDPYQTWLNRIIWCQIKRIQTISKNNFLKTGCLILKCIFFWQTVSFRSFSFYFWKYAWKCKLIKFALCACYPHIFL